MFYTALICDFPAFKVVLYISAKSIFKVTGHWFLHFFIHLYAPLKAEFWINKVQHVLGLSWLRCCAQKHESHDKHNTCLFDGFECKKHTVHGSRTERDSVLPGRSQSQVGVLRVPYNFLMMLKMREREKEKVMERESLWKNGVMHSQCRTCPKSIE